jgi:D-alanine--poly(phosphoribitol) ligase subunit 1
VIHSLLGQALINHASRVAVIEASTGRTTSYLELEHLAAGLDRALATHESHVLVIFIPKGPLFYAAILRCLVQKLSFCCLDEGTPLARIREVCRQFEKPLLLGDVEAEPDALSGIPNLSPSAITPKASRLRRTHQRIDAHYYVTTSGSTGTPKIVKGRQSSLGMFVDWSVPFYGVNEETRWAQFSGTGFDLTLVDLITVLCAGGTLVALSSRFDRLVPTLAIEKFGVTHWHSVPSAIPHLIASSRRKALDLPQVFTFCGEPLDRENTVRLRGAYPEARIVNTYGPTEGTLFFMAHELTEQDLRYQSMPLGTPIPGWAILLRPEPECTEFECVVVSDLIADGYVGFDGENFGSCTINKRQIRTFHTGDLLEIKDNKLFFGRRADGMVKIKGLRVELGEIESVARLGGAANPVAFKDGEKLHLAYEESLGGPTLAEIRATFAEQLPVGLHPSLISLVSELPRNSNGKIARTKIGRQLGRGGHE